MLCTELSPAGLRFLCQQQAGLLRLELPPLWDSFKAPSVSRNFEEALVSGRSERAMLCKSLRGVRSPDLQLPGPFLQRAHGARTRGKSSFRVALLSASPPSGSAEGGRHFRAQERSNPPGADVRSQLLPYRRQPPLPEGVIGRRGRAQRPFSSCLEREGGFAGAVAQGALVAWSYVGSGPSGGYSEWDAANDANEKARRRQEEQQCKLEEMEQRIMDVLKSPFMTVVRLWRIVREQPEELRLIKFPKFSDTVRVTLLTFVVVVGFTMLLALSDASIKRTIGWLLLLQQGRSG